MAINAVTLAASKKYTDQRLESSECGGKNEIYIGSGEMPEGYVLQIDPEGTTDTMSLIRIRDKSGNYIDIPALQGESAYNIAVRNGYTGTEQEWLESLKGEKGEIGKTPIKGQDYWTEADIAEIQSYIDTQILGGTS